MKKFDTHNDTNEQLFALHFDQTRVHIVYHINIVTRTSVGAINTHLIEMGRALSHLI